MVNDLTLFNRFAPVIRDLSDADMKSQSILTDKLLIERSGSLKVCYTPFEYVNPEARLVIIGITPGFTQMSNAVKALRNAIRDGEAPEAALAKTKVEGAFSGQMRKSLIGMLDRVGINRWLGVGSCADLFGSHSHLVHTASMIRNATFVGERPYNGTPKMTVNLMLRQQMMDTFVKDAPQFKNAYFLPLGAPPRDAIQYLVERGLIPADRVLPGAPHPSGGNNGQVVYFLGNNEGEVPPSTSKGNAAQARAALTSRVAALAA